MDYLEIDNNDNSKSRGLLIVFEGCNFSGKTTIINDYVNRYLPNGGYRIYKFPNRNTKSGKVIDNFLKNKHEFDSVDDRIKLFAENRKEQINNIIDDLQKGMHVICDRYVLSGVAYPLIEYLQHNKLEMESTDTINRYTDMLIAHDTELIKPDIVFIIDSSFMRNENERYHSLSKDVVNKTYNYLLEYTNQNNYYIIYNKIGELQEITNYVNDIINNCMSNISSLMPTYRV